MASSRRAFLSSLTWTGFAAAVGRAGELDWSLLKQQFPLEDGLVYLNAANVCPASRLVLDRHAQYMRDFQGNPSFQNRLKYEAMRERLRGKVAGMLRVNADEVAITRNTSEGTNIVVKGVDLKPGDEVLITEHNHPSNNDSWKVRAARDGFTVKTLPVRIPAASKQDLIDQFERAIGPKTKVVSITHVTSTTGIRYPAREIAAVAKKRGAWMHLDGAQSFGALDVNLAEIGCDSYAASAHKWAMGPLEAGVLVVKADRLPQIWPSIVTAGWSDHLVGARKLEVYGQRDDPRIVALESAVDFLALLGMPAIEARVRVLTSRLKDRFAEVPGAVVKTNREPELSGGVVKVDFPKSDVKAIYDRLWDRHRVSIALTASGDSRGLRFSPHVYNSIEEMDHAAKALRESL